MVAQTTAKINKLYNILYLTLKVTAATTTIGIIVLQQNVGVQQGHIVVVALVLWLS